MRILIFHGYLLRGTGSNVYNANLARTLAGLGHQVDLFCQDRTVHEPEGVTIHVPDIGRLLPVYVADCYEGFDALPFPELDEAALGRYLGANVAAVRSVPPPDIALANHLVMGPVIVARGLEGRAPYAVKVHGTGGVAIWQPLRGLPPDVRLWTAAIDEFEAGASAGTAVRTERRHHRHRHALHRLAAAHGARLPGRRGAQEARAQAGVGEDGRRARVSDCCRRCHKCAECVAMRGHSTNPAASEAEIAH